MLKPNKNIKTLKSNAKVTKDYKKSLVDFSVKINKSMSWFLSLNKNVNELKSEFERLNLYWEEKANETAFNLVNRIIQKIINLCNLNFKKQGLVRKTQSKELNEVIKAHILENIALIKSIPQDTLKRYESVIYNGVNNLDKEAIVKQINTIKDISKRRAEFIARDQVAKATQSYAIAKARDLGFEYFKWVTMHDERVSKGKGGHKYLDGRYYRLDKPTAIINSYGNVGLPSQRPNCRCLCQMVFLEPNQKMKLIKDKEHGDYYEIVEIDDIENEKE